MIQYRLRLNHHADDHGPLLIEALRPAAKTLATRESETGLALRTHWGGGPHILIAFDLKSTAFADEAIEVVSKGIVDWFERNAAVNPKDVDLHKKLWTALAEAEQLFQVDEHLHENHTVEIGIFPVPDPYNQPGLAAIRDRFKVRALSTIFDLIETRLQSPALSLVHIAGRFAALERCRWQGDLPLWPLSLRGQARIGLQLYPAMAQKFPAMLEKIGPHFRDHINCENLFNDRRLSSSYEDWVGILQDTYDRLWEFTNDSNHQLLQSMKVNPDHARRFSVLHGEMDPRRVNEILTSRYHFPYRMLINFMYDLVSEVGFVASRRFFIAYLIDSTLEQHYPSILMSSKEAGAAL